MDKFVGGAGRKIQVKIEIESCIGNG